MQVRSQDSMSRMLDAGEELFLEGGAAQLKLNLIIQKSGSSTGSFYARFTDMQGYLDALHNRALERVSTAMAPVMAKASAEATLQDLLTNYLTGLIAVMRQYRGALYFFAVGSSQVSSTRQKGAEFTLAMLGGFMDLVKPFMRKPLNADAKRRLDMAARQVSAMAFQIIMFEQHEVSNLKLTDKELAKEWAAGLNQSLLPFI